LSSTSETGRDEALAAELTSRAADDDLAGPGNALDAGSQIRGGAERQRFAAHSTRGDDDEPRVDADARLDPVAPAARREDALDFEPGTYGPYSRIFERLRVAEIDHHAIAEVLRHVPADALARVLTGDPVLAQDFAEVFRIHALRQLGRPHEIAEHHRELSSLARIRFR
jgi:hypothetical protein